MAMVKIAPDKSLPQTKNRGQRLTLTEGLMSMTDRGMLPGGSPAIMQSGPERPAEAVVGGVPPGGIARPPSLS